MTQQQIRVRPEVYLTGLLRQNIQDPNPNRQAGINWIYPDYPLIYELSKNINNFPRISVTRMTNSTVSDLGIDTTDSIDTISLLINIWCIKKQLLPVRNGTFNLVYQDGTLIYPIPEVPISVVKRVVSAGHTFKQDSDFILVDYDEDGLYDSIMWIGNTPAHGATFLLEVEQRLSNEDLAEYLAQEVHVYLRENWRQELPKKFLWNYRKASQNTLEDLSGKVIRTELRIDLEGVNIGD